MPNDKGYRNRYNVLDCGHFLQHLTSTCTLFSLQKKTWQIGKAIKTGIIVMVVDIRKKMLCVYKGLRYTEGSCQMRLLGLGPGNSQKIALAKYFAQKIALMK